MIPAPIFDYQGLACPEPVIRLHSLLKAEKPEKLTILVDNEAAQENITRVLAHYGYAAKSALTGTIWQLDASRQSTDLQSASVQNTDTETLATYNKNTPPTIKTLILITNETIGQGDVTLGERLMENFLATLPEMADTLWRIILLNGGAKLAAQEGKCLESLKKLESLGVSILVCGTCLTFYGLMASKAVGDTTNMLDVVTSLDLADKVIRP